jgi:hypothetical protein
MSDDDYFRKQQKDLNDVVESLSAIRREIEESNKKLRKLEYFDEHHDRFMFETYIVIKYLNPVIAEIKSLNQTLGCSALLILCVLVYIAYFVSKGHW